MSLDINYEKDFLFFCILQKFQFYSIVISDKAHNQFIFPGFAFNITYDGLVTTLQRCAACRAAVLLLLVVFVWSLRLFFSPVMVGDG